jgi:ADP-ribose pyrophosphatase
MALKPWKKLKQSFEIKNPWWTYRKDEVQLPTGKQGEYHFVHVNGSSMVIPILNDGRMILVSQYRYLVGRESIEFPCGSVKDGSTHEETARLELAEESGYEAQELKCVAEFNPYNGVTDEMCKVFIARGLSPVDAKPDETEEFERIILEPKEFDEKVRDGIIWDGMTLAAWAILKPQLMK